MAHKITVNQTRAFSEDVFNFVFRNKLMIPIV